MPEDHHMIKQARYALLCAWFVLVMGATVMICAFYPTILYSIISKPGEKQLLEKNRWIPPDPTSIPNTEEGKLILYGRELVSHTAIYLGPKGKVKAISNGMNCQNCHLKAGTLPFGNNYSAVASTYPKFRERSGSVESIEKRINDCFERSLNGQKLSEQSKEMLAFVSYIKWLGKEVPKKVIPTGAGLWPLPFLDRPADSIKGKIVYQNHCSRCHGLNGSGVMSENQIEWKYPPLHGRNSFNIGAGLYRLSRFAGYVKANMPNDLAKHDKSLLTDEESWDVAAYVLSSPRPSKDISSDWPDISKKPFDHPFGPYADNLTESQHKYGPFASIRSSQRKSK